MHSLAPGWAETGSAIVLSETRRLAVLAYSEISPESVSPLIGPRPPINITYGEALSRTGSASMHGPASDRSVAVAELSEVPILEKNSRTWRAGRSMHVLRASLPHSLEAN